MRIGLLVAGMLGGCATAAPLPAPVATVAPDGAILLKPGQPWTVDLHGNATTGYVWQVESDPAVKVDTIKSVPDSKDPTIVGSGSTETYRVVADRPGLWTVTFRYLRPWEGTAVETRVYRFRVE